MPRTKEAKDKKQRFRKSTKPPSKVKRIPEDKIHFVEKVIRTPLNILKQLFKKL